jgi:hypothetical protein
MNYSYFFWILILLHCQLNAQLFQNSGAISTSMAGLDVNNENVWSINNNIAHLSKIENPTISISSFQPFLVKDFITSSLVLGLPTKDGAFGFNYSSNGNKYLRMHNIGLGYSKNLGMNLQSGIKLNYFLINAGDFYNKKSLISADIGLSAKLSKEFNIGMILKNPTLSKLSSFNDERLSTSIQFAAGYKFSNDLTLHTGIKKDINYPTSFLTAIYYQPNQKISINGGIGTKPNLAAFGMSFDLDNFTLSIASQVHQVLGWSPDFSIVYQFK